MDDVGFRISTLGYAKVVKGGASKNDTVFAFGQCMKDTPKEDCDQCFATSKTQFLRCKKGVRGAKNYLDGCFLRYDDYDFFEEAVGPEDTAECGMSNFEGNRTAFGANMAELMSILTTGPRNKGFIVASVEKDNSNIYGMAQCWKFINESSCNMCLGDASAMIRICSRKQEGRVFNSGCYMRFSINHFFNGRGAKINVPEAEIPRGKRVWDPKVVALVAFCAMASMIIGTICFIVKMRATKKSIARTLSSSDRISENNSGSDFKYEVLARATNYFSNANKLGQGGCGSVYKGILPDGSVVAVKRMLSNAGQQMDNLLNEVNLISGINHKNLVKLLGCSITGPESLLVYEYVPNKTLHHYFSDSANSKKLNWEARCNIILGVAEGLIHLHEEVESRIIHRDIKLSNVLLDDDYTAKIADFGLAKLFPDDITHISTVAAGTFGYIAPEYMSSGKLSDKADVFSFGVLLLEVVTGKRSNSRSMDPLYFLQMIWDHYESGRLPETVDAVLEGRFPEEKASRVLHVGLLCTQASYELRPSMSTVMKMLKEDDLALPPSTKPPFVDSSIESAVGGSRTRGAHRAPSTPLSLNRATISDIEPR